MCKVYGPDTVFLQQAAHLTNGSYIYLERRDALLQYLMVRAISSSRINSYPKRGSQMSFLSPPSIRKVLAVPTQDKIDFRAACFCHKNIVDIGFVCSVCLSSSCAQLVKHARNVDVSEQSSVNLFPCVRLAGKLCWRIVHDDERRSKCI